MGRRPLIFILIAVASGIFFQRILRIPSLLLILFLLLSCGLALYFVYHRKVSLLQLFIALALLGGYLYEVDYSYKGKLNEYLHEEVLLYGSIIQKSFDSYDEYYFLVDKVYHNGNLYKFKEKALLYIDGSSPSHDFKNKSVIITKGRIDEIPKARNPKTFDYQRYLKSRKIYSAIYADFKDIKVIGDINPLNPYSVRSRVKDKIYSKTLEMLGEEGRIALSIVFGEKSILDDKVYSFFKDTGTAHILAISGLHFGILYGFLTWFFNIIRVKKVYSQIITIFLVWSFAYLVEYPISGIRAASLITLAIFANLLNRRYDLFSALALVGIITLILNPLLLFDVGLQLSFIAVFSIGIFYKEIKGLFNRLPNVIGDILSVSLAAQLGIIPIMSYHFNVFNTMSMLFNIPAIFLTGYILPITIVFFIFSLLNIPIAAIIGVVDKYLIKVLVYITSVSEIIPFTSILIPSPKPLEIILYYGILLAIRFRKDVINLFIKIDKSHYKKGIYIAILIMIFIILSTYLLPKDLTITFIDVGQGDSILIQTPTNKRILIDGGLYRENNYLTNFLLRNQIKKIDVIILSHPHGDHYGGLINVIDSLKVKYFFVAKDYDNLNEWLEFKELIERKGIPIKEITKGDILSIDNDIVIRVLHPGEISDDMDEKSINNNSLVFVLEYKNFQGLFTGDIEKEAISSLLKEGNYYKIDLMKIPHHGSRESITPEFIDAFEPNIGIIQVGKNTYGHPHKEVIELLEDKNVRIYRNDIHGGIIVKTNGYKLKVKTTLEGN